MKNFNILKRYEKKVGYDIDKAIASNSIREFDKYMTAPINGFKKQEDFYVEVSSFHYIQDIKIPVLFIHSLDDPVCIKECIPFEKIKENENCMLILT